MRKLFLKITKPIKRIQLASQNGRARAILCHRYISGPNDHKPPGIHRIGNGQKTSPPPCGSWLDIMWMLNTSYHKLRKPTRPTFETQLVGTEHCLWGLGVVASVHPLVRYKPALSTCQGQAQAQRWGGRPYPGPCPKKPMFQEEDGC